MTLLLEYWKPIVGFPDYQISNTGRILRSKTGRVLKDHLDDYGYRCISLPTDKGWRSQKIHILVALTFLGSRPHGLIINHDDGWKPNCRSSNLEYVTYKRNTEHAIQMGLYTPGIHWRRINPEIVREIRTLYPAMNTYEIARRYNISDSTVSRILTGKIWRRVA